MEQKIYNVIGVMSGTSLDGIDCALTKITRTSVPSSTTMPSFEAHIEVAQTIPYTPAWKNRLAIAHTFKEEDLKKLNEEYTIYLAAVIKGFIRDHHLHSIDAVCSHGHTILHQPDRGFTLQIGNTPHLAKILKQRVVCDFRAQDVALGGQGAPLVPIGDLILYSQYDYCLNLGGFANVSLQKGSTRVAYDICPVNVVLNRYAQELGAAYDAGGAFAKAGTLNPILLEKLNKINFYQREAPKSLGIEWVHQYIFPLLDEAGLTAKTILATFTEHIAMQLASQFREGSSVLVTGGGAYNHYLLARVAYHKAVTLEVPDAMLVEFKEALIFGLLGVLKLEGLPNCLASVTGAKEDHSSGMLYEF